MGSGETVDPDLLDALVPRFEGDVGRVLGEARGIVASPAVQQVAFPNFTTLAWSMAIAYVEAANFMSRNFETKLEVVKSYGEAMKQTAADWRAAEEANTVSSE